MAKNTGRGSRFGGIPSRDPRPDTTWIKRNTSVGIFADAKKNGGSFMGLSKQEKAFVAAAGGFAIMGCLMAIVHFVAFIVSIVFLVTGIIDITNSGPDTWSVFRVAAGGIYLLFALFRTRININTKG